MELRQGSRVTELTRKVGQVARRGKVKALRGESVEVEWDDGHRSVTSRTSIVPERK